MAETLAEILAQRAAPKLALVLGRLAAASGELAARLRGGATVGAEAAEAAFVTRLRGAGIRWLASSAGGLRSIGEAGGLALALDPLQCGPSAAGEGLSGTLFSLRPALSGGDEACFLTPGKAIVAAGAVVYGSRTRLAMAVGGSAAGFTLESNGAFLCTDAMIRVPEAASELAANLGHYRQWDRPVQRFIDDCLMGPDGPRAAEHDLLWTGCLAAELHRTLGRGGLFVAPRGDPGLPLTILQAHPLAFLAEASGGMATDGQERILDRVPASIDAVSPLVFGSAAPVTRLAAYHDLPGSEASPLFSRRGLFRQ